MSDITVGFVAPSSVVPPYEFELGLKRLKETDLCLKVHPQCKKRNGIFAGTDEARARAIVDYAFDPDVQVIWCARGGYGAYRLLSWLDRMVPLNKKPPHKLFVGYSDSTVLLEYVRARWGWSTLHAPMPGLKNFLDVKQEEMDELLCWIHGWIPKQPFGGKKLKFYGSIPNRAVEGRIMGGNLSVWSWMIGTRFQPRHDGAILFLEEVGETLSRLDKMIYHLVEGRGLDGVKAIVLGDFKECTDPVSKVLSLKKGKKKPVLEPSRESIEPSKYLKDQFTHLSETLGIPVAYGLPVGHGPGKYSLPLGVQVSLARDGQFTVLKWGWEPVDT